MFMPQITCCSSNKHRPGATCCLRYAFSNLMPDSRHVTHQAGVPVCDYQLEAEGVADVTARACELLGSHLIAGDTLPFAAEEGHRLQPPDAPWAPFQEQVSSPDELLKRRVLECGCALHIARSCPQGAPLQLSSPKVADTVSAQPSP
jgi:hypothetical protein